ncbi:hypothetical protein [Frankia sp. KB5]|uniref:hypothetical protein n=1 Tax=Frankia sp. KB5 TaxID=683318 RepID=UPI0012FF8323|nr:hypothetical protein [Frankia sp. KB5]
MMKLAAGHHLYPFPDGTWRAAGPGDVFLRVAGPPEVVADLRDRLLAGGDGSLTGPVPVDPADAAAPLVGVLREHGVLVEDPAPAEATRRSPRLHVDGDGPVARLVAELAAGWAEVRRGPLDEAAVRDADVVMACAGWLPDAAWRRLGAWCGRHGTAWTRCHAEGLGLFVGPLTVPGRSAGYTDVRSRRLAAADSPDELLTLWAWLDRPGQPHPPVTWPARGVIAVAAGLMLGDVERWWATDELPDVDVQWEIGADGVVTRHPVLPLPVVAAPVTTAGAADAGPARSASTRAAVPSDAVPSDVVPHAAGVPA